MKNNILEYRKRILDKIGVSFTNRHVLDVGCGNGGDAQILAKQAESVIGIDCGLDPMWGGRRKDNLQFLICDARHLAFPRDTFDIVFAKDVMHHIKDYSRALSEMMRVLKLGGNAIIVEANRYNPIFYVHMTLILGHQHFTKQQFSELILSHAEQANFKMIESRVYPTQSEVILKLCHVVEDLVERIPLFRNFLCYNVAIVTKTQE